MSFNVVTFAVSKRYTDTEVAGGGAIQGKNCVISSIADIPATESKPAGQRVTFQWTLDNGTVETGTMDVYNGADGESIDRMYVNEEGHLIVVYDNGESEDCGEITIPSSQSDWAEDDPEENSYIQHKELVYSAINDAVSAERSARQIVEAQLSAAISAISDDVSSQGTAIGAINRQLSSLIDDVGTNTSAIYSINTQLSAIIDDVGTNTSAISSINHQLSAVIDDVSTNTSAISAINQDLASRADIKSIGTGLDLNSTTGELTATGGGGGTTDYADLTNKPSINNVTLSGNKTSADLGFGTASALNVASSGDASSTEIVKGDDTRLTDSRNAADVYSWAKASTKPTYTASEVGAVATSVVGTASGVAELDATGKVPSSQLPSYVDDVVEYASTSAFPVTGESGKIYIALDTNKTYRWGGSEYVEISESLALGETASTAYAGNKGKANADAISAIKDGQIIDSFGDVETALSDKADKVTSATNGNFAGLDSNGNLTDSGSKASDFLTSHQDISGKADKVSGATNGNFAGLDSNGNLTDSGSKASDFLTSHQDISGKANLVIVATVEASTTASKAYSVGDRLILNGVLYKATDAITSGGTIVTTGAGANVTETTIDAEIAAGGGSGHDSTKADLAIIAANFSDSTAYSVGDYVAYNGALYKCTTDHAAGSWDANDFTAVTVGADKQNKDLNTAIYIDGYPRTDIEALFGAVDTVLDHDKISGHNIARKSENSTYYPGQLYQIYDAMYGTILFYLCKEEFTGTPGTNPNSAYFERVLPSKLLGQRVTAGAGSDSSVGKYATAEGSGVAATGLCAHAEGWYTSAGGYHSPASGVQTIAQRYCQFVLGKYNVADTTGNTGDDPGTYLFIIGNGSDANSRSNAFTVDWDGNVNMAGHSNDTHVEFTIPAVSSLPVTVYSDDITADMKVVNSEISSPSAILSDLTVTTAAGSCTVSGTISGTTDITLQLARVRAITVSTTQP